MGKTLKLLNYKDICWANSDPLLLEKEASLDVRNSFKKRTNFSELILELKKMLKKPYPSTQKKIEHCKIMLFVSFTNNQFNVLKDVFKKYSSVADWHNKDSVNFSFSPIVKTLTNLVFLSAQPDFVKLLLTHPKLILGSIYYYHHFYHKLQHDSWKVIVIANNSSFEGKFAMMAAKALGIHIVFIPHGYLPDDESLSAEYIDLALCGNMLEEKILYKKGLKRSNCKVTGHLFIDLDQDILNSKGDGILICTNPFFDIEMNHELLDNISTLGKKVRIRFHPAEDFSRYGELIEKYGFEVSHFSLKEDIKFANQVYSSYSSVAYVAFISGRKVTILPQWPNLDTFQLKQLLSEDFDLTLFEKDVRPLGKKVKEVIHCIDESLRLNRIIYN